jgi:hypothetical protein
MTGQSLRRNPSISRMITSFIMRDSGGRMAAMACHFENYLAGFFERYLAYRPLLPSRRPGKSPGACPSNQGWTVAPEASGNPGISMARRTTWLPDEKADSQTLSFRAPRRRTAIFDASLVGEGVAPINSQNLTPTNPQNDKTDLLAHSGFASGCTKIFFENLHICTCPGRTRTATL